MISETEYITSLPVRKQATYWDGLSKWDRRHQIPQLLQLMQKNGEQHYDHADKLRGRCIFNPSSEFKVLTGVYNKNVINAVKSFLPEFVHGLTCDGLEEKMTGLWRSVEDPEFGDADGSSHDAHEHAWKIRATDIYMHSRLLDEYCARMGYTDDKRFALRESLLTTIRPYVGYYYGTRVPFVSGLLNGTVYSGASTLTTLGNTLRMIIVQYMIRDWAHLTPNDLQFLQAGDDQLQIINQRYKQRYELAASLFYNDTERMGGIGYLVKKQNWGGNVFNFLSKTGGAAADRVIAHRLWHRAIIGGNFTHKIRSKFTEAHHRWAINSQLASWIGDLPILSTYLRERQSLLTAIPSKRALEWVNEEDYYKMLSHSNAHAGPGHYEPMMPFIYGSAYNVWSDYTNSTLFYDHVEHIGYC